MKRILAAAVCAVALGLPCAAMAQGPSFNCINASRADEVLICQNPNLSALDRRMSSKYFTLRNQLEGRERGRLEADQSRWLRERMSCGRDYECVAELYRTRIRELDENY